MHNTPLLSIIIPNYNNAGYLKDCIESILKQTYTDYEIIISDDCSDDNSVELIREYEKNYLNIKALNNRKNIGVSKNRHNAILNASGKYITTLDSDDVYLDPQKLEKEMQLVQNHKTVSGKDICAFSNVAIVDDDLNFIRYQWPEDKIKEGDLFIDIITRRSMIPRDFIFLRSDYFQVGGYDPGFNLYEDWDLKIRLARKREFYFTNSEGVGYRRKGEGLSYVSLHKHIHALRSIFNKNIPLIESGHVSQLKAEFDNYLSTLKLQLLNKLERERKTWIDNRKILKGLWVGIKKIYYRYSL